jgi:hypothetical protein
MLSVVYNHVAFSAVCVCACVHACVCTHVCVCVCVCVFVCMFVLAHAIVIAHTCIRLPAYCCIQTPQLAHTSTHIHLHITQINLQRSCPHNHKQPASAPCTVSTMHTRTHAHTHTHTHTRTHTYIHTYTHSHTNVRAHTHTHTCTDILTQARTHTLTQAASLIASASFVLSSFKHHDQAALVAIGRASKPCSHFLSPAQTASLLHGLAQLGFCPRLWLEHGLSRKLCNDFGGMTLQVRGV